MLFQLLTNQGKFFTKIILKKHKQNLILNI